MSRIEFRDVTVIYDEEKVNKKMCKKKSLLMNLWCLLSTLVMFIILINCASINCNMPQILLILVYIVYFLGLLLGNWLIYRNTIKAFDFMDRIFKIKNIHAGWYLNNEILLRVKYPNRVTDYSLRKFIGIIKNELVEITDKSDRNKPIHIFIDITNKDITSILIDNTDINL